MSAFTAELVTIGNEVLAGRVVNSNAAKLSAKLLEIGIPVSRQTTIPDQYDIILETLSESLACTPLVIATGGLGPTIDDLTREAAAEIFDSPLVFDPSLEVELKSRFGDFDTIKDQATVPEKAQKIPNLMGSASGFIFYNGRSTLILLPGVFYEMEKMLEDEVIPYLKKTFSIPPYQGRLLHFANLYESQIDPELRKYQALDPSLKLGIYPSNGLLTVSIDGPKQLIANVEHLLLEEFREHQYEASDGKIETAIQELCIKNGWTLSLAESCTGGAIAAKLTQIPGASAYFLGSLVAYSNQMKRDFLNISEEMLKTEGAVSPKVALQMAEEIQKRTSSHFALSITGIAGPTGGTEEKPVGTLFMAIKSFQHPPKVFPFRQKGTRLMLIERSVNIALGQLYKEMHESI